MESFISKKLVEHKKLDSKLFSSTQLAVFRCWLGSNSKIWLVPITNGHYFTYQMGGSECYYPRTCASCLSWQETVVEFADLYCAVWWQLIFSCQLSIWLLWGVTFWSRLTRSSTMASEKATVLESPVDLSNPMFAGKNLLAPCFLECLQVDSKLCILYCFL